MFYIIYYILYISQVIRYQKQLQLNYVQMYKRNKTLESEVVNKIQIQIQIKQIQIINETRDKDAKETITLFIIINR